MEYTECETCTGVAICNQIVQAVANLGLDPEMCRAQTYDGAGNIVGSQNGCAKHFQEVSPRAVYFHCASHELNLGLDLLEVFAKAATRVRTMHCQCQ